MKDEYSFISSKKSYIVQNNGRPASFIVLDADNWYNALNRNAAVLRSYKKGKPVAQSTPGTAEVLL